MTTFQWIKISLVLWFEGSWVKRWVTDGWLTQGQQIACPSNQGRAFALCDTCSCIFPNWDATMTAAEAKKRGFLGCKCGGMRLAPARISSWRSVYWFVVRGWLIRHVLLRKRVWDPRIVVLMHDLD